MADLKVVMIRDIEHVIIRWGNGDITIVQRASDRIPEGINIMGFNSELAKELKPLLQDFE